MTASSVKMAATISGSPFSQASIHCALPLSIARLASANVSGAASGPADGFLACEKTGWAAKRKMIVPRRNRFILESPFVRRTLYRRKGQLVGHRTDNMSHAATILPYGRTGANIGKNGQPVIRCCYPSAASPAFTKKATLTGFEPVLRISPAAHILSDTRSFSAVQHGRCDFIVNAKLSFRAWQTPLLRRK